MTLPRIIQGGMGAGVSGWELARAVAALGEIGVVSGTALDLILVRRLQTGDPSGNVRRALAAFPDPAISRRIVDQYFFPGGKPQYRRFAAKPMVGDRCSDHLEELLIAANFVEVTLAKEGHGGQVGINYLNKIQAPLLPSIYGAMLAGVDIVLVGAGIPIEIPHVLDGLCAGEPVELRLEMRATAGGKTHTITFDPGKALPGPSPALRRPLFFPIVASATLATLLVKKCPGKIDGLIIEEPSAGGHNAPPRGNAKLSVKGEPVYGSRDVVNLDVIKALGPPFWLAGSYGSPEKLAEARAQGAAGVQIGTLFAFCDESGMRSDLKRDTIQSCLTGRPEVFRDPVASPTGFPFQVLSHPGTLSEQELYTSRGRQCDLGYLREPYERPDGSVGWRCAAEHPETFIAKGGKEEDTVGRKCLCNSLMANIGLAQIRSDGTEELPLITCGSDLSGITRLASPERNSYTAIDVLNYLRASPVDTVQA